MNLPSTGLLRRPLVAGSIAGVVVLSLLWWFAWMTPEAHKLAAVRQQQVNEQQSEVRLTLKLAQLSAEAKQVHAAAPFLGAFGQAIPASPDAPDLVVAIYRLAVQDGVSLQSVTDNSVVQSGLGYSTIPVALALSGPHDNVLSFVAGLYQLSRLLTVQSVALSGSGNLNSSGTSTYTATIAATAYTRYVAKTTPGTS